MLERNAVIDGIGRPKVRITDIELSSSWKSASIRGSDSCGSNRAFTVVLRNELRVATAVKCQAGVTCSDVVLQLVLAIVSDQIIDRADTQ